MSTLCANVIFKQIQTSVIHLFYLFSFRQYIPGLCLLIQCHVQVQTANFKAKNK